MSDLTFADLDLLWVLGPLLAVWLGLWWLLTRRSRRRVAVRFSNLRPLRRLAPSKTLLLRRLVMGLRIVVVALLVLGLARPQTGRKQTQVRTEGIDIVLVIDTSGSMRALDLDVDRPIRRRRNRLEVAKAVVEEFVGKRLNDQIGLVVFGTEAFTQCPLTLDHGVVSTFLDRVEIGVAGDLTAIGAAIGTAVKRLQDSEAKSRVIVLLTDGRNNAGSLSLQNGAEVAASFGVKIYAIGVGTRGEAPFLEETIFGEKVEYRQVDIDDEGLTRVAETTGGAYFRAEDRDALTSIYEQIDELEKTEITMDSYMEYEERFRGFVLPAVALLLLETVLLGTRFRRLP